MSFLGKVYRRRPGARRQPSTCGRTTGQRRQGWKEEPDLAESLKKELEKNETQVLSVSSLKKTEEIEKIARRIRARLKHF